MKTLIVYHSAHHMNTEKIARAMGEVLSADLKQVSEIKAEDISGYDLIGFGSGIYFSKHHKSLLDFTTGLPCFGKKVFIFSTSGMGKVKLHQGLKKLLSGKGCNIISEFACKGFDTFGPFKLVGGLNKNRPNQQDIEEARSFAEKLKSSSF